MVVARFGAGGKVTQVTRDRIWLQRNLGQFLKFAVVGGSGVIVNMAVGITLHKLHGGTINAGEALWQLGETDMAFRYRNFVWVASFLIANVWNYQINRTWTFKGHGVGWWRGFWPFLAVGSIAMFAGLAIQWALTHPASLVYLGSDWFTEDVGVRSREYWAQIIAILFTMPINFVVNKLWTFRHRRGATHETSDAGASPGPITPRG